MRLATRCFACGTIFRVVQDQLRVSEGWVRCGRCAELFDAAKQLFNPDREPPPPWLPASSTVLLPPAKVDLLPVDNMQPPLLAPDSNNLLEAEITAEVSTTPADIIVAERPVKPDSRQEPHWTDTTNSDTEPSADMSEVGIPAAVPLVFVQAANLQSLPGFMRKPAGDRWRKPGVQLGLSLLALLLVLLLGAQVVEHFHDAIAAKYPTTRQTLRVLCEVRACELKPWRRIDALSVDSSSLSKAAAGNQYLLALTLHNKTDIAVATPSIELTLTDQAGKLLARRMLAPEDFEARAPLIAANADLPLKKLLSTGEKSVAGYSIEIFNR